MKLSLLRFKETVYFSPEELQHNCSYTRATGSKEITIKPVMGDNEEEQEDMLVIVKEKIDENSISDEGNPMVENQEVYETSIVKKHDINKIPMIDNQEIEKRTMVENQETEKVIGVVMDNTKEDEFEMGNMDRFSNESYDDGLYDMEPCLLFALLTHKSLDTKVVHVEIQLKVTMDNHFCYIIN